MGPYTVICVTVVIVACCKSAMIGDEARPVVETDIELTAHDSDAGNWTANLGDIEVKIEHRHGDTKAQEDGSWTLDVARMLYEKQNGNEASSNNPLSKEDIEEFKAKAEVIKQTTEGKRDENALVSDTQDDSTEMSNDISDYNDEMRDPPKTYYPPVTDYPPPEYYADLDEVVLDPDGFEYFKGVGWFKLDSRHLNWDNARAACAEVGAHLAIPDTQERVRVFLTLFQRHSDIPAQAVLRQQAYVGVSDPYHNRMFTTVHGVFFESDFPIWFHNEPNNEPPGEDCVSFHIEGRIRDVPCLYELPFFCEKYIPLII